MLFSLSRVALHRLTELGFSDAQGPPPDAPVRRRPASRLCEGQYIDIWTSRARRDDVGRALLRHDRAQDGGPDRGVDRGRRAARDRRRGGHRPLPARSAGRSGSRSSSTTTCSASGARSRRPARSRPTSPGTRRRCPVIYALRARRPRRPRAGSRRSSAAEAPTDAEVAEAVAILERSGARDYTRDQARRYRDEALAELDAAGIVEAAARAGLERIIVSVISA